MSKNNAVSIYEKFNVANNGKAYQKKEYIGYTGIKVTVHIPDDVPNKQKKINTIYDILKPCKS